ncbi:MAG: O-antigen ligase family protein [Pyrinomonadaceae bacterium]
MEGLLKKLDDLAGIENEKPAVKWLERIAFVFLILMLVSAPHSIAATQTAWITGMFVWVVRLFFRPRLKLKFGALDFALWGFFAWSVVSSVASYEPATSIDKLRGTALFLIFYFIIYNLRNLRAVYFAAFILIFSCMVNVLLTPVQRLMGRGVEIQGVRPESPLAKALLREGDTLLTADGIKFYSLEEFAARIEQNETTKIKAYRPDYELTVDVKRADILPGSNALEKLGIESWKKSRNWRSKGFYGHYATYAEVLQLIASLVFALLVAGFAAVPRRRREIAILAFCLAAICLALLFTVTRASQLAFMISAASIVIVGLGRKWIWRAAVIGLPVAIIGLLFLQQSREVGFFDAKDDSIKYRQTMWRDGIRIWTESPRHFVVGVGMDSIQKHWQEWDLFDKGHQPMGHFHSTPVQLLVERGLPALLLWLIILGIYARTLWKGLKQIEGVDWRSHGILLGCLGGTIGFFASGLVHYNLGDQEVAMVFFIMMGLGVKITQPQPPVKT